MADINITTDFTQLNDAQGAIRSTDALFVKFVDSLLRESKRADRVTKALADTTQKNLDIINKSEALTSAKLQQESDKREKARAREATRAEKESQRIEAANQKVIASEAKLAAEISRNQAASAQRSTAGLNQRLGVTGTAATGAGAGFGALEGEIERLRLKYDQVYASSQLYEKSLSELSRAHMLGVTSAKQHESAVEQLNIEYQQFSDSAEGAVLANNRFSQHINQTGAGINKFGMYAQQVGYQVGDFFVQVQSGTNVLVAFGQQATQLAGLFPGVLGAALGIGISLATAIGAAFMRTGESAKKAGANVKELEERIKALDTALRDYLLTKRAESMGITPDELTSVDAMTKATNDLTAANARLAEVKAASAIAAREAPPESGAGAFLGGLVSEYLATDKVAIAEADRQKALEIVNTLKQKSFDLSTQEAAQMQALYELEYTKLKFGEDSIRYKDMEAQLARDAFEAEQRSLNLGETHVQNTLKQYDAQLTVLNALEAQNTVTAQLTAKWDILSAAWTKAKNEAELIAVYAGDAGVKASQLSHLSFENIASAATEALRLAGNLGIALDTASRLSALGPQGIGGNDPSGKTYSGRGGAPSQGDIVSLRVAGSMGYTTPPEAGKKGGGGGGGGANPLLAELETLQAAMMTQEMTQIESYARQQETLQSALEQRLITQQEYAALMQSTEMSHANEMFTIKQNETNLVREASRAMYESLGGLLQVFAGKSKAAAIASIALNKALAIASIIQNTAAAQMKAMFEMGPILGPPAAAKIGLMGKIQAGIVAATGLAQAAGAAGGGSVGGMGGGSGRGSAAVAAPSSSAPAPQTVFIDSLDPDGLYSGQALINLFDAFYDENDKRGKVFMVAR